MPGLKNCPACQTPNHEWAKFCKKCGAPMPGGQSKRRCPNGHIMEDNWEVCAWCGRPEDAEQNRGAAEAKGRPVRRKTVREDPRGAFEEDAAAELSPRGDDALLDDMPTDSILEKTEKDTGGARKRTVMIRSGEDGEKEDEAKPRLVGFLVTYDRDPAGAFFEVREGRHTIGRSPEATLRIQGDRALSSEHAVLLYRKGRFIFQDNLSTNGSAVNGQEVMDPVEVGHGDVLTLGGTRLVLVVVPGEPAPYRPA